MSWFKKTHLYLLLTLAEGRKGHVDLSEIPVGWGENAPKTQVPTQLTFIEHLLGAHALLGTAPVMSCLVLTARVSEISAVCSFVPSLIHQDY